eukprot:810396-Rhodomonas_salina.1
MVTAGSGTFKAVSRGSYNARVRGRPRNVGPVLCVVRSCAVHGALGCGNRICVSNSPRMPEGEARGACVRSEEAGGWVEDEEREGAVRGSEKGGRR